jgi:hypothetical protein
VVENRGELGTGEGGKIVSHASVVKVVEQLMVVVGN